MSFLIKGQDLPHHIQPIYLTIYIISDAVNLCRLRVEFCFHYSEGNWTKYTHTPRYRLKKTRLTVVVGELQVVEMWGEEILKGLVSAWSYGQLHCAVLLTVQYLHVVVWHTQTRLHKGKCSANTQLLTWILSAQKSQGCSVSPVMVWNRSALYSM